MKFASLVLIAAALYGCALSPADLREQGQRVQLTMRLAPPAAAACVARNAEDSGNWFSGHLNTSVREGSSPGHVEVVFFSGTYFFVTATFAPEHSGAMATVWTSPHLADTVRNRMLGAFHGC